jgi:predicted dehydrogenase
MKVSIIGTGKIVHEALAAMAQVPGIDAVSVFARPQSRAKAEALAREHGIPAVYTDYAQLLQEDKADFLYIGLANHVHAAYARQALRAGRNVILEKPFAPKADEVQELKALAEQQGCYLVEAVTPYFLPNFAVLRRALPQLGTIRAVQANYSQYSSRYDAYRRGEVLPAFDPALSGGALYDINYYNLCLIVGLFGRPSGAQYTPNRGFNGVDTSGVAVLSYDGFFAEAVGAKDSASPGFFLVQGEQGWLRADGAPNELPQVTVCIGGQEKTYQENRYAHRMVSEFEAIRDMLSNGDRAQMSAGLARSLAVAETMDALRRSAGLD